MQVRGSWRPLIIAMLASLAMLVQPQAGAQTTEPDTQTRAQLAAIPLTTGELPQGYSLVTEAFVPAGQAAFANVDPAALDGFVGMYASVYRSQDVPGDIVSYASAWTDAAAAEAGFATIEDEAVTAPDASLSDGPLDAGTGPAEMTTGTVEADGASLALADATFVVDRFVVGVTVRTAADQPMAEDGVGALVGALEARADAVVAGESPAGTDLALPAAVIDVRAFGTEQQAGFLSSSESEALYGLTGSSLGGLETSWVTYVGTGAESTAPWIAVAVSTFEDAETAGRVVEQSADLVPLTVALQPVDGYAVDGVDAVRGYQYTSPGAGADAAPDSFRAVARIGTNLVVIDVQGAASVEQAQAVATELLSAQVRCGNGDCQVLDVTLGA